MLNENQKNKWNARAKKEGQALLGKLNIKELTDDNIGAFATALDLNVSSLVSLKEEGQAIDEDLLNIYDLLTDIVLDNEENLDFLNKLFLD